MRLAVTRRQFYLCISGSSDEMKDGEPEKGIDPKISLGCDESRPWTLHLLIRSHQSRKYFVLKLLRRLNIGFNTP